MPPAPFRPQTIILIRHPPGQVERGCSITGGGSVEDVASFRGRAGRVIGDCLLGAEEIRLISGGWRSRDVALGIIRGGFGSGCFKNARKVLLGMLRFLVPSRQDQAPKAKIYFEPVKYT